MSGDWLDDIDGVKGLIDASGETPITQPRYAKLRVLGNGVAVTPNPVEEANDLTIYGTPAFTAEKTADYTAKLGEFVVMADEGTVTLPLAASGRNRQIGVFNKAGEDVDVAPSGGNTLNGSTSPVAINNANDSIILQSDGVNSWWIVARSTT